MNDIKIIRKNPEFFSKKIYERNVKIDLKDLLDLDKKNRTLIQSKEKLEQKKKLSHKKRIKACLKDQKKLQYKLTY